MGTILSSYHSKPSTQTPIAIIDLTNDSDTDDENQIWSEPSAIEPSIPPIQAASDIGLTESVDEEPQFSDALNEVEEVFNEMNLEDSASNKISEVNVNKTQSAGKQDGESGDTVMNTNAVLPKGYITKVENLDEKKVT